MAHRRTRLARALLLAGALAAGLFAFVSWADRRRPVDALPAGAGFALEAAGVADLAERLEDTRFAAAFSRSALRAWLESSDAVAALDAARADVGRATGFTPARRHLLDLVGKECAVAWYPARPVQGQAPPPAAPWLAAGRLSWRAWAVASALRVPLLLGLGGGEIAREDVAGTTLVTLGSGEGASHVFLVGRLFVAASDRSLAVRAANLIAGTGPALAAEPSWSGVFARLPASGALRLWTRGDLLPPSDAAAPARVRAAGAVVSAGSPVTVDVFADVPAAGGVAPSAPPSLALGGETPLLFFSTGRPLSPLLSALLERRAAEVARFQGVPAVPLPPATGGFALALTSAGEGLFPLPEGLLTVGMRDAAAAREALRLLFPARARSAETRWGTALTTRESLPLAGETELWGAVAGSRLVLATRRALLDGLQDEAGGGRDTAGFVPGAAWPFDTVGTVSVARLVPVLRRYAAPLNGLARARRPDLPGVAEDISLLASVRSLSVTAGTSAEGTLARVTADVGDLPAGALPPGR